MWLKPIVLAAATLLLSKTAALALDLSATPTELKTAFESYTAHVAVDPKACSFAIWDKSLPPVMSKAMLANAFAACPIKSGTKVCTAIATEVASRLPVQDGCLTGFERMSFLPIAALSPKGGFFVVVYESGASDLKLVEQLTLGFGPDRDFCELSAVVVDKNAKPVGGRSFHAFTDLVADELLCRGQALK